MAQRDTSRGRRAAVILAWLLLAFHGPVLAQKPVVRQEGWVVDGIVHALARHGRTIYLGGDFLTLGPYTGSGASVDAVSGDASPCPPVDGTVYACVPDGQGGWFIGGTFTNIGGRGRARLAHLLSDGSVDPSWSADANGDVEALLLTGMQSNLYVGGGFTQIGGQPRNRIASVMASNGWVTGWNPDVSAGYNAASGHVVCIALSPDSNTVYFGGNFTNVGGVERRMMAAVAASNGAVRPWNPSTTDHNTKRHVYALVVTPDLVYVGGLFTNLGGQLRNKIAAVDSNGVVTAWDPAPLPRDDFCTVTCLALSRDGTALFVGGEFTNIGGQARLNLAKLDVSTGSALPWIADANLDIYDMVLAGDGETLYAGGNAHFFNGQFRHWAGAIDAGTGAILAWDPRVNRSVRALAWSAAGTTNVYVGGDMGSFGGWPRHHLAAIDALTGRPTSWDPNAGLNDDREVLDLAVSPDGGTIYVAGTFTNIGGQGRRFAAAIAADGSLTSWDPGLNGNAYGVACSPDGRTIYLGGAFTNAGGLPRNGLAAFDTNGNVTTWNPGPDFAGIEALKMSRDGTRLYVGGYFWGIGGQTRSFAAAVGTNGVVTEWDPSPDWIAEDFVEALDGSVVYVGGNFQVIGGSNRNYIAALDPVSGRATGWNPGAGGRVRSLGMSDDGQTLFAGGAFTSMAGQAQAWVAALDSNGVLRNWRPKLDGYVCAFAWVPDGSLVLGGGISTFNGQRRHGLGSFESWSPVAFRAVRTNGCFAVSLTNLTPGATFTLQRASSPGAVVWDAVTNIAATGAATNLVDLTPTDRSAAYRVMMN